MYFKIMYYFNIVIINSDINLSTSGAVLMCVNTYSIMCFAVYVMIVNNILNATRNYVFGHYP
jgi:hypothetical protein